MKLSSYAEILAGSSNDRYKEKISLVGSLDPFLGPQGESTDCVPPVRGK